MTTGDRVVSPKLNPFLRPLRVGWAQDFYYPEEKSIAFAQRNQRMDFFPAQSLFRHGAVSPSPLAHLPQFRDKICIFLQFFCFFERKSPPILFGTFFERSFRSS